MSSKEILALLKRASSEPKLPSSRQTLNKLDALMRQKKVLWAEIQEVIQTLYLNHHFSIEQIKKLLIQYSTQRRSQGLSVAGFSAMMRSFMLLDAFQ